MIPRIGEDEGTSFRTKGWISLADGHPFASPSPRPESGDDHRRRCECPRQGREFSPCPFPSRARPACSASRSVRAASATPSSTASVCRRARSSRAASTTSRHAGGSAGCCASCAAPASASAPPASSSACLSTPASADRYQVALRLAVDGLTTRPFTATTLPPEEMEGGRGALLRRLSAERYGRDRALVEREVAEDLGVAPRTPSCTPRANLRLDLD